MPMDTILLVEDDQMVRHMLKENLEHEQFIVFTAGRGDRMFDILHHHKVDLILLDLRLPDGSGLDFISDIRRHTDVPVIIVSGERSKSCKVTGLQLGADDFVAKPCDPDELIARIQANLRRYRNDNAAPSRGLQESSHFYFGQWKMDCDRYQIFNENDEPAHLTMQEFRLLERMVKQAGHVIHRDDLCEVLREDNYVPTSRAIDVKITRIRKKIGDDAAAPYMIKTVRGAGYFFEASILK
jgi:two-component system OmpR family response regulator